MSTKFTRWLFLAELTVLFALVFQLNIFNGVDPAWFGLHQADSEAIVLSGVYHQKATGGDAIPLGYYSYPDEGWVPLVFERFRSDSLAGLRYTEYSSNYGLQGHLFGFISRLLHTTNPSVLEAFNSIVSGLLFALFVDWVRQYYGPREAIAMAIGIVASTWIIVFARNLYWVSWTWFLPMTANGALLLQEKLTRPRWALVYGATAITVWIKALCGYEYISTITVMACIPAVLYCIEQGIPLLRSLLHLISIMVASVFGFGIALLMHASARAPNLLDGLRLIKQDAIRRTEGLAGDPTIGVSRVDVLKKYLFDWDRASTAFINIPMWVILLFAILSVVSLTLNRKSDRRGHALGIAFIFSLLGPLSWLLLAKQHSVIHTHMNYVLWYTPSLFLALLCITRRWSNRNLLPQ
ncbi:MAG: hypothetical protein P4M06_04385 [Pandoraea sp.]|nr:hypothetical protein [Pandoraea sp.]MDR3396780.1 hypothetical protein [Pandoraea sp.]